MRLMDAAFLAVSSILNAHDLCETIPDKPEIYISGILMKMTVPKK